MVNVPRRWLPEYQKGCGIHGQSAEVVVSLCAAMGSDSSRARRMNAAISSAPEKAYFNSNCEMRNVAQMETINVTSSTTCASRRLRSFSVEVHSAYSNTSRTKPVCRNPPIHL